MPLTLYNKEQIINACLTVFARYGYGNTSTSMLAEAAGVSKSLLFHHFKNKEQLYFSVLDQCLLRGRDEMDFENLYKQDFFQSLEKSGIVRFGYYRKNPDSHKVVREAFYATPEEIKKDIEKKYGMVSVAVNKGWKQLFDKVALRKGVQRQHAFNLVMLAMDYFDNKYLTELADVKNLDETRLRNFLEERNSFLNILRSGIEKSPGSSPR